jgi:hypothetical protein
VPARISAASVWTGTAMLIWGGSDCQGCGRPPVDGGAAYNPATDRWTKLAPSPLTPTFTPSAVWTGTQMVVLAQGKAGRPHAATYDPATDTWTNLPDPSVTASVELGGATWIDHQAIFGVLTYPPSGIPNFAAFSYTIGE